MGLESGVTECGSGYFFDPGFSSYATVQKISKERVGLDEKIL